jgi:hypothetical protein
VLSLRLRTPTTLSEEAHGFTAPSRACELEAMAVGSGLPGGGACLALRWLIPMRLREAREGENAPPRHGALGCFAVHWRLPAILASLVFDQMSRPG